MAALRDEVIAEGVALLSITSHLNRFLAECRSERTYLHETEAFFGFVEDALTSIYRFVQTQAAELETMSDTGAAAAFRDLKALERIVGHIYYLVRQVCDADTLSIPFPIIVHINGITKDLPEACGARNSRILLLATDQLNFLHRGLDVIRQLCAVCDIVPAFPQDLGIVAFPYTERNSICLNCLLFHELGHYLYHKGNISAALEPQLVKLDAEIANLPAEGLFDVSILLGVARERVLAWASEVFADLVATGIVGPSFAVALDKLIRLSGAEEGQMTAFSDTHPAGTYRKTLIAKLLLDLEWRPALEKVAPDLVASLDRDAASTVTHTYPIVNVQLARILLQEFDGMVPHVKHLAEGIIQQLPFNKDDFLLCHEEVIKELKHLVVPTIRVRPGANSVSPSAITVLNCGALLLGRRDLADVFALAGRSPASIDDRLWLEDRLNLLVMKAIEDGLVVRKWQQT